MRQRLTSISTEEVEDCERVKEVHNATGDAQADRISGQGVVIEHGDKDRSEVEDLSSKIRSQVFTRGTG